MSKLEGAGGWTEIIDYWIGGPYQPCLTCNETGSVSLWKRLKIYFWDHMPVRFIEWYEDWRYPPDDIEQGQQELGE